MPVNDMIPWQAADRESTYVGVGWRKARSSLLATASICTTYLGVNVGTAGYDPLLKVWPCRPWGNPSYGADAGLAITLGAMSWISRCCGYRPNHARLSFDLRLPYRSGSRIKVMLSSAVVASREGWRL
jgi:hypothetical protein